MKEIAKSGRFRWTVTICYVMLLTFLLLTPDTLWEFDTETGGPLDFALDLISDSVAHLMTYALLVGLLGWSFRSVELGTLAKCILLATAHGILSEFLQGFVPGRTPELRDLLWDLLGIILGAVVFESLGPFD